MSNKNKAFAWSIFGCFLFGVLWSIGSFLVPASFWQFMEITGTLIWLLSVFVISAVFDTALKVADGEKGNDTLRLVISVFAMTAGLVSMNGLYSFLFLTK